MADQAKGLENEAQSSPTERVDNADSVEETAASPAPETTAPPPAQEASAQAAPAAKRTEWHVWSNTVRDFFVPVHSFSGPPPAAVRCVS